MRMYSILPTGRRAVLALRNPHDADFIASWVESDSAEVKDSMIWADVAFQERNKAQEVENSCPISSLLTLICVDQEGREFFGALDPGCRFLAIRTGGKTFFVYRASARVDAIESGWVEAPDGRRRLRGPVFRVDAATPSMFQLPSAYESAGETICSEEVVMKLKKSNLSGLCLWDHEHRREELL